MFNHKKTNETMKIETKLNINTAMKHLFWRFNQSKIILNDRDREAFNLIVRELNLNYETALMENKILAKLLLEKILMLTLSGERSMKDAIRIIDEIIDAPLSSFRESFKRQVPLIRLSRAFEEEFIRFNRDIDDKVNCVAICKAVNLLSLEQKKRLESEFMKPYTDEEFIFFIKRLVFDTIKKHQNKE